MSARARAVLAEVAAARAGGFGLAVLPGPRTGPGWRHAHDFRDLGRRLEDATAAIGCELPAVAAAWHLEKHAWHAASLVLAAVLVDDRLPPLMRAQIRDDPAGGLPGEIAVPVTGWTRAGSPDQAARALSDHLAPVVAALSRVRASRALWREAGDRVGQAALWCAEAFGDRRVAIGLATRILEAPTPLRAPAGFTDSDPPTRRRTGCCLSHRCPGGAPCEDCPLVPAPGARAEGAARTVELPR